MQYLIILYSLIFVYGIVVGSFLNVCILRIPEGKTIVSDRSHCMTCGYQLRWYDLFPLFSYLFLRGKCRQCGQKISIQYPMIEALNGVLWVLSFLILGITWDTILVCLLISALLVLSIIDFRTYEIPFGINVCIFVLGVVRVFLHLEQWETYLIGVFAVSVVLLVIYLVTGGRGIGGGDVKLMAAAGLFLGWQLIIVAFFLGCFYGSVIHILRMKISGEGRVLAMGPYLSLGIVTAVWFGPNMIAWYLSFF